jgi:hypothetical protein
MNLRLYKPLREADRGHVGAAAPSARTPAHPKSAVAQGPAFRQVNPDIAGTVAAMTESDPGVESEKASHNTPG